MFDCHIDKPCIFRNGSAEVDGVIATAVVGVGKPRGLPFRRDTVRIHALLPALPDFAEVPEHDEAVVVSRVVLPETDVRRLRLDTLGVVVKHHVEPRAGIPVQRSRLEMHAPVAGHPYAAAAVDVVEAVRSGCPQTDTVRGGPEVGGRQVLLRRGFAERPAAARTGGKRLQRLLTKHQPAFSNAHIRRCVRRRTLETEIARALLHERSRSRQRVESHVRRHPRSARRLFGNVQHRAVAV